MTPEICFAEGVKTHCHLVSGLLEIETANKTIECNLGSNKAEYYFERPANHWYTTPGLGENCKKLC